MELKHRTVRGVEVIALEGRFDASEIAKLNDWYDKNKSAKNVVVNLEGVTFIDSSGLSTLVKGLKRCRQNKGDLYLSNLQQSVRVIFELTRLDKAFTVYEKEAQAVKALASSSGK